MWLRSAPAVGTVPTARVTRMSNFPERDELRGTDNDYESEESQLIDTHAYGNVSWGFILFVAVFFRWSVPSRLRNDLTTTTPCPLDKWG